MKLIVLAPFWYNGEEIKLGLIEGGEAELLSMSYYGRIRPATSTEIEKAGIKIPQRIESTSISTPENASMPHTKGRKRPSFSVNRTANQYDQT